MRHLPVVYVTAVVLSVIQPFGARVHAQYNPNPNSEMSEDKNTTSNKTEVSEESHEIEIDDEEKEKKFLDDAMKMVLDPQSALVLKTKTLLQGFQSQLDELDNTNITFDMFMAEMDNLSLEVCKTSQDALWSYVMDINNDVSKNVMVRIAAEEDEIKKQYWNILKKNYLPEYLKANDTKYNRKIRIIKERGTNVQMPQSKQREEIDTMQKIWSRVSVCAYNATTCDEDSVRSMSVIEFYCKNEAVDLNMFILISVNEDIRYTLTLGTMAVDLLHRDVITIFKTSNDSKELKYYWAAYRDATGKKVRPIFKDYVERMNVVAEAENFTDAGQMWQYAFEDDDFVNNVNRIWREIKPLYDLLHNYVRLKLIKFYPEELSGKGKLIPAHILGNLWAQEWQSTFQKVVPYPMCMRPVLKESIQSKDLFDAVNDFHQSLGFESAQDSYQDIKETATTANCLPSSHDMCDGVHYKIKWCGEKITDVVVGLSRAARLLGHVQYFKHYKNLPPLYRDGPNPAFHDAISDIVAIQLISPEHLKTLNLAKVKTGAHVTLNHLLWVALEKFPLMAYAYVLDQWRWDVFKNSSLENWNEHWWDLRINETGVSPPVPRNESDLDPAAKYHVVSHVQYITYLISHVLEFQILLSLCNRANHTGPLHECSIYGVKEAGKVLSDGMSLGASMDWRTVLQTITGETELSTQGILNYFAPLEDFLRRENVRLSAIDSDMDKSAPMIIGGIAFFLFILIIILYCVKKRDSARKMFSFCGLSKNGSLDIVTNDVPMKKRTDAELVSEDKV